MMWRMLDEGGDPMRLAVMADIHGHLQALEAVLDDAGRHQIDRFLVLGDIISRFPQPRRVLEQVTDLAPLDIIHGNGDLFVARFGEADWSYGWRGASEVAAWHRQRIGDEWARFLQELPDHRLLELPQQPHILMTHGLPGDPYHGIMPKSSAVKVEQGEELPFWAAAPERVRAVLARFPANLVLAGHTHWPAVRHVAGRTVLNPGAVMGLMRRRDGRAEYMLLDLHKDGTWRASWRAVSYDVAATLHELERLRGTVPHIERLAKRLKGFQEWQAAASGASMAETFMEEEGRL